jgi:hypothetical protein
MNPVALRRVSGHRCFNHAGREAVARCVSCGRSYCRECVAEHDGRMICASCLRAERAVPQRTSGAWWRVAGRALHTTVAVIVAWLFFYATAQVLLDLPSPFHEGSMWSDDEWQEPEKP